MSDDNTNTNETTDVYDLPDEEFDKYLAEKYPPVQAGAAASTPQPVDHVSVCRKADEDKLREWAYGEIDRAPKLPSGAEMDRLRELMTPDEFKDTLKKIESDNRYRARRLERREHAKRELQRRAEVERIMSQATAEEARKELRSGILGALGVRQSPDRGAVRGPELPDDATPEERRQHRIDSAKHNLRRGIVNAIKRGAK